MGRIEKKVEMAIKLSPKRIEKVKNNFLRRVIYGCMAPYLIVRYPWLVKKYPLYLDYFEVVVTTRCSLRCKNCANLMQYYQQPQHVEFEVIEKSLKQFIENVDLVKRVGVLGGEPFLYKELDKVLSILSSSKKIEKIRVVTNGTIIPNEETLKALKLPKVVVQLNCYMNAYYEKVDEIVTIFEKNGIKYQLLKKEGTEWMDYGNLEHRGRSEKELEEQFSKCRIDCRSLFNGKIFYCPRSGHGMDLNLLPHTEQDYVDLMDSQLSRKELRYRIFELMFEKKYIEACNHCNKGTNNCKIIPAGEQLGR